MDTQSVVDTVPKLPTEFTIGGRTYELVSFLRKGESYVSGYVMVARAEELNANLGKEDGQFILEHQGEIPVELRGKVYMVFTSWYYPLDPRVHPGGIAYLRWNGYNWSHAGQLLDFGWGDSCFEAGNRIDSDWDECYRLVRRRHSTNPA